MAENEKEKDLKGGQRAEGQRPKGAMEASERSMDSAGGPIPATPAAKSLSPEQHRAIEEHLEAANIRHDTAKRRVEVQNAFLEKAKGEGLKVRAIKKGFTRELSLKEPDEVFILSEYEDLDGNTFTAEDQFSPRWMERLEGEPGSKEARQKKPLSEGAKKARQMAWERLALEAGKVPLDREDDGEYVESAAVRREDARDRAAARLVQRTPVKAESGGKKDKDKDAI